MTASAAAPQAAPYSPDFSHSGVCIMFSSGRRKQNAHVVKYQHSTNERNICFYFGFDSTYSGGKLPYLINSRCEFLFTADTRHHTGSSTWLGLRHSLNVLYI